MSELDAALGQFNLAESEVEMMLETFEIGLPILCEYQVHLLLPDSFVQMIHLKFSIWIFVTMAQVFIFSFQSPLTIAFSIILLKNKYPSLLLLSRIIFLLFFFADMYYSETHRFSLSYIHKLCYAYDFLLLYFF